jgi:hypothetical protein
MQAFNLWAGRVQLSGNREQQRCFGYSWQQQMHLQQSARQGSCRISKLGGTMCARMLLQALLQAYWCKHSVCVSLHSVPLAGVTSTLAL